MALNYEYPTQDAIPAEARSHYAEADNGQGGRVWVLQGSVGNPVKLDEFRNNNKTLFEENKKFKTDFDGVDPTEYKTLKGRAELIDNGKVIALTALEEKINARLEPVKKDLGDKLTAAEQRAQKAEEQVARHTIDGAALTAATDIGIAKGAQPDIIARVRAVFSMGQDGKLVAKRPDGKDWCNANGDFISPAEYVKHLATEAPHLFAQNSGGGAGGSGGGGGGGAGTGVNPWDPKINNLSEMMRIYKEDPEKAKRMAAQHGLSPDGRKLQS